MSHPLDYKQWQETRKAGTKVHVSSGRRRARNHRRGRERRRSAEIVVGEAAANQTPSIVTLSSQHTQYRPFPASGGATVAATGLNRNIRVSSSIRRTGRSGAADRRHCRGGHGVPCRRDDFERGDDQRRRGPWSRLFGSPAIAYNRADGP
jgi:hypothetical protein